MPTTQATSLPAGGSRRRRSLPTSPESEPGLVSAGTVKHNPRWTPDDDGVENKSDQDAELLDAAALCAGHLVAEGSVAAFLAEHRRGLFPDDMFEDLSRRGGAGRRCRPR